jgi:hypothetical protein
MVEAHRELANTNRGCSSSVEVDPAYRGQLAPRLKVRMRTSLLSAVM